MIKEQDLRELLSDERVCGVRPTGRKTALVFSGAGAKIIVEAGMAKAFVDLGLDYDYVIGTSSGAIVASALHGGQVDDIINFMLTVKNKDVYKKAWHKVFTKDACYLDNTPLKKTLTSILDCESIRRNSLNRHCIVNVCDLHTWEDTNILLTPETSDEDIIMSVLTSTSVPGAFRSYNNCVDGGIVDNYPMFDAVAEHCDRVIVFVTSTVESHPIKNVKDMIGQVVSIMLYNQFNVAKRALELFDTYTEVIVVQVPHSTGIPLLDFDGLGSRKQRLDYIHLGYQTALDALKNLEK